MFGGKITRFACLRVWAAWLSFASLLLVTTSLQAATTAQINNARVQAIAWLLSNQQGDGSWRSGNGSDVQATAAALQALSNAGLTGAPFARGLAWIANAEAHSVDASARQIIAMAAAGMDTQDKLQRLIGWRNRTLAWGAYDRYSTSFPDTPLASNAIRTDGTTFTAEGGRLLSAMCQVILAQKTGGSWNYVSSVDEVLLPSDIGAVLPTTYNILELSAYLDTGLGTLTCAGTSYNFNTVINAALNWLLAQRLRADGGFSEPGTLGGVGTPLETALVYLALTKARPTDPAIVPAQDFLIADQDANGSWNNDAFATAMVGMTLPATALVDTDQDGVPDVVEAVLGMNPAIPDSRVLATGNGRSVTGVTTAYRFTTNLNQSGTIDLTVQLGVGTGYSGWTVSSGQMPDGMSLGASTGIISGIPTSSGTYSFTVTATNLSTGKAEDFVSQISVNSPPQVVNPGTVNSNEGDVITLDIVSSDPDGDIVTYSASGLPPGLSLNLVTGRISGNLNFVSNGTYNTTVSVTDSKNVSNVSFSWIVANVPRAPVLDDPGDLRNQEGDTVSIDLNGFDPDGDTIIYASTGLPPGLSLSQAGVISGTIGFNAATTYNVVITASDGGLITNLPINWTVTEINRAPVLSPLGIEALNEGDSVTINFSATDPDGDALTYSTNTLPSFITLIDNGDGTGALSVNPNFTHAGSYGVQVIVTDNASASLSTAEAMIVVVNDVSGATSVVKMQTPLGDFEVELYGNATPNTVANFLTYVNDGDYNTSFVHDVILPGMFANVPGGLIQGGIIRYSAGAYTNVPQDPPVAGEPGFPNIRSTIAMQWQTGGDPNSATSQWFINIGNNSSTLNAQGYTVFGRVIRGMNIVDTIASQGLWDATATLGTPRLPLISYPGSGDISPYLVFQNPVTENVLTVKDYFSVAITGSPYRASLPTPIGGVAPYSYLITSGSLPGGMSMDPATGVVSGTPAISGVFNVTYTVTDNVGQTASGTLSINANAPPTLQAPASQLHEEGQSVTLQIVAGGAEAGETLAYGATNLPPGLTIDTATGLVTGTINAATAGTYNSVVSVSDGTYTISIGFIWTVDPASSLLFTPISSQTVNEGDSLSVPLSASGAATVCFTFSGPAPGFASLVDNGDGTGSLELAPGFTDAGAYVISIDANNWCTGSPATQTQSQTVSVTVIDVNQPPTVTNPGNQTNTAADVISLQIVAVDPEGDPLLYDAIGLPPGLSIDLNTGLISGTVSLQASGNYSVAIGVLDQVAGKIVVSNYTWTIIGQNLPPTAVNDSVTTPEDAPITINVLANDSDPNGDVLAVSSVTAIVNGSLQINPDNTVTYTPNAEFSGVENFTYTLVDAQAVTATATVTVTVTNVNDAPVITDPGSVTNVETDTVSLQIVANDAEGDSISYSAVGLPQGLSINSTTGVISGVLGFTTAGSYNVTLTASDAVNSPTLTFNWTVGDTNRSPVATAESVNTSEDTPITINVLSNDSDPDGDSLTVDASDNGSNGSVVINPDNTVTYTPNLDYNGVDTFAYIVGDGKLGLDTATVTVNIASVNDNPVASPDTVSTYSDTPITFDVLANDSDADGDTLTVSSVTQPGLGSVVNNLDGTVTYTPQTGFTGVESFNYLLTDGVGGSGTGVVSITVSVAGDVNGDGLLNAGDLLLATRHVLGLIILDASSVVRGDLYPPAGGDGQLNLSDLILIQRAVLGQ